jgi:hypothetical protein
MLGSSFLTSIALVAGALPGAACDRVGGPGLRLATPQALVDALEAGERGCVRGDLRGDVRIRTDAVTLRSAPGQVGSITGQVVVEAGADHVTVEDLRLDGRRRRGVVVGPLVLGDDAAFLRNDVTNGGTGICFIVGSFRHDGNVLAEGTLIEHNRIHDCGRSNNHMHGVYLEHSDGARIVGNELVRNADRAIQLYPSARRTLIAGNVIDDNGQGILFSGGRGVASSGNVVRGNVLANPRLRAVVESFYPDGTPDGTGNVVERNCLVGAPPLIDSSAGGFRARGNVLVEDHYVVRSAEGTVALRPGGPCDALLAAGRSEATSSPERAAP